MNRGDSWSFRSESAYDTLAGFVLMQFGRIPTSGDHFEWQKLRFEVVDMDRNRIDKVLVTGGGERRQSR